jgi:hypothetical protein
MKAKKIRNPKSAIRNNLANAFCAQGPCPWATRKGILKVKVGKREIGLDKLISPVIMDWIFFRRCSNFPYFLAFREGTWKGSS